MSNASTNTALDGEGKRLALVIGVNTSTETSLEPLKYAEADAEAMAQVLKQHGSFELFANSPLIGAEATTSTLQKAVRKLARERNDDTFLLLYFSGHALPMNVEADQRGVFLVTHDFDAQDVDLDENAHLSLRWLRKMLYERTNAGRVLIILDCCFAGEMGANAPDHYFEELKARIRYYFEEPNKESRMNPNGQRLALSAVAHNVTAREEHGYGLMTGELLSAFQGREPDDFDREGEMSVELLYNYLRKVMPTQPPDLSGSTASRSCVLAIFAEQARALRAEQQRIPSRGLGAERPETYIPFPRNPLFQPRPGEFEALERLLVKPDTGEQGTRVGLVGVTGLGGVGKTQLAVELAYRLLEQDRYPDGIFWMPATGKTLFDWQRDFAGLAFHTGYLLTNDDQTNPENEVQRARYLCRYLANHDNALLILDNIEEPELISTILPTLAGREMACAILYTSRKTTTSPGTTLYSVTKLSQDAALRLLLATTRPLLLEEIEAGKQSTESEAAHLVCQRVGYLPLALTHLRGLLERDKRITCMRLAEVLQQRDAMDIMKALFVTFHFSWEQISDERAKRLFLLASYYPEAVPIPLWLLGVAAGLGESADSFEPLGEASLHLQERSLFEELSGEQVRLHPLVREFGQKLARADTAHHIQHDALERLLATFTNLNVLEQRALQNGYWTCLDQIRTTRVYAGLLRDAREEHSLEPLQRMERWLDRESYLLTDAQLWPRTIPALFFQQLYNRAIEAGTPLRGSSSARWLRQQKQIGAEDRALLRILSGHTGPVYSVAFSLDGRYVLTGSSDKTARLWERESGRLLASYTGHTEAVFSVAFSPDGRYVLTGSFDTTTRLWEQESGRLLASYTGHTNAMSSVAFSPDGRYVLTGSYDETARLWERESRRLLANYTGPVSSVAFSPDGRYVLTGSDDKMARLWERESGRLLASYTGHTKAVYSVAFSPDGRYVLTGSDDKTARLWERESGRFLVSYTGHTNHVSNVAFSPDGRYVLTGSLDTTARLWERKSGRLLANYTGHTRWVNSVAFSPDGRYVLTGSLDTTARLWEREGGRLLVSYTGHTSVVSNVAFSPDGRYVLTGSWDTTARLWERKSGRLLANYTGHTGLMRSVTFSPDGCFAVTCDSNGRVYFWKSSGAKMGILCGMYTATYEVRAVYWVDERHVLLADAGESSGRWYLYQLELEGEW